MSEDLHRDRFDPAGDEEVNRSLEAAGGIFAAGMRDVAPSPSLREDLLAKIATIPQSPLVAEGDTVAGAGVVAEGETNAAGLHSTPVNSQISAAALKPNPAKPAPGESEASEAREEGTIATPAAGNVVSLDKARKSRVRWILPRVVGIAATFAIGTVVGHYGTMDEMSSTSNFAALNQAQDVTRVVDTMPDGHVVTLTWSQEMGKTAVTLPQEMQAGTGHNLQVWIYTDGHYEKAGMYDPDRDSTFAFLDMMPSPGTEVIVTEEPANGTGAEPTGKPLVIFKIGGDPGAAGQDRKDTTGTTGGSGHTGDPVKPA